MLNEKNTTSLINCTIITMDEADSYYPQGVAVIEDGKIAAVGRVGQVTPRGTILDMAHKILLPGFINTHTHSPSPLFRGMADDLELMDWLRKLIWPAEKHLSGEAAYWGASLSCLEFLESGVTTFADQYFFAAQVAEAIQNSGLRGFVAPTLFTEGSPETKDTIGVAVAFIENYRDKTAVTRIYPCIGPHAPYSCSPEVLRQAAEIAACYHLLLHTHISETADENKAILELTGLTPTQYLDSLGVLDQKVLAAHSIHLNQKDLEIYREKDVKVSYNPISNLKLVSGIMPLKAMLEQGITVGIGTDGAQSNNSLDLLSDLKTGALLQKQFVQDATFLPAREALRMITISGARALGMGDQLGSIETGKMADLVTLDFKNANLCPFHPSSAANAYSAVIYAASGKDVADVFVAGELLMKDRQPLRVDRTEIIRESQKSAAVLMKKAGLIE